MDIALKSNTLQDMCSNDTMIVTITTTILFMCIADVVFSCMIAGKFNPQWLIR